MPDAQQGNGPEGPGGGARTGWSEAGAAGAVHLAAQGGRCVRSMTGFGRGDAGHAPAVSVEARATNHRHLDLVVRLPREYGTLEDRLRAMVRQNVHRGRVEMAVSVGAAEAPARAPRVDTLLASQYHQALRDLAATLGLPYAPDVREIVALPGVLAAAESSRDPETDWPAVAEAARAALAALGEMRAREGRALAADLGSRAHALLGLVDAVEERLPVARVQHLQRLAARVTALTGEVPPDGFRSELAALVERADIAEELVRLRSHLRQFRQCLDAEGPVGRRLDFLAQECHREWTTIAAKAVDVQISEWAVDARVIVEQLREQAQNVE